ncbi:MAG: NADH:flavin oxidoreductase [Desulfobacterales bacterium]|nr:NADH:flavin oxidoreductase [Desulfobacterales bacterium]
MATLFERTSIGTLTLENRFVRSATWEGMAKPDGACSKKLIDLMVQLALGGVGLIISGHAYVSREGQASPWQLGVYTDELIPGLTQMTRAVHDSGGKIVMQLAHAGCHGIYDPARVKPAGPSVMETDRGVFCMEMTVEQIRQAVEAFGRGAARAQNAGFDGVQIHAAHGYLLSQFLSPFYNQRGDSYGGALENRMQIVIEVLESIREKTGGSFPVLIKMNSEDFLDRGLSSEEMIQVAQVLEKNGIDAIELSGGTRYSGRYNPIRTEQAAGRENEAYYLESAVRYKKNISVPLLLVGGIRSYEFAARLIHQGAADYISLCRPLIREPNLIHRWKSGNTRKASCLSENLCFNPARTGEGVFCVVEDKLRLKQPNVRP